MKHNNDVVVTFRTINNYNSLMYPNKNWWVNEYDEDGEEYFIGSKYIMEVRSSEFHADVSMKVFGNAVDYVSGIASCLMAGLKLIDGHELVFDNIVGQFKSGLGIDIDRAVSPKIAVIRSTEYKSNLIQKYNIEIPEGFGYYQSKVDLDAHYIEDLYKVEIRLSIENRGKKIHLSQSIDADMWHEGGPQILKLMKYQAINDLHEKYPELGMDWAYLKAQWFDEPTGKYGPNQYATPDYHKHLNHAAAVLDNGSKPPPTVAKLPGVNEKVKNPVTGTQDKLWRVIVNLNDRCGWSRERVADWLETLDIDITFRSTDEQD